MAVSAVRPVSPKPASGPAGSRPAGALDIARWRKDFPILKQAVHGRPLAYLDNAATTQKPRQVLDTLLHYYTASNANIHRGVHTLSERATAAYEAARATVQRFVNAPRAQEIIFVRGATEGINLVAQSFGRSILRQGDEVLISVLEHHSNIVPWQILCTEAGATLRVIPCNDQGELLLDEFHKLLGDRTRLVSIGYVSNAIGTINPVKEIVARAHERGARVLVDAAQAAPHLPIDVQDLDCDFLVFSGHKMYGPTGAGVLYGKSRHLEAMPPYQGGGDMISSVTFERTQYNVIPYKFEAGTPHISGAIGLAAAIDYVTAIGLERIAACENDLLAYATRLLGDIQGVRLIGTARHKAPVVSFTLGHIHAHDVGTVLDQEGVAVRTGHHCAMPLMDRFGVGATVRASFALYNTRREVDALAAGLRKALRVFGRV